MPTDLLALVRSAMIGDRGRGVVVAVSGGGDSVGLLRLLFDLRGELDLTLTAAHLDHGTRGDAGRADAGFVAELAATLGLPFISGNWSPTREAHFEADARDARYAWLVQVAKERGAGFVAVGHTRNDQAETILHRMLRGTGIRGLAGMPARRALADGVTLVRPLLGAMRHEIRAYLASIGQPFREDATNADPRRTRNRLRNDLLPKLRAEYNPQVEEALARLGEFSAQMVDVLKYANTRARRSLISRDDRAIAFRRRMLARLPIALRVEFLRRMWRGAGWPEGAMSAVRWRRLAYAIDQETGQFDIGGGVEVRLDEHSMTLTRDRRGPTESPAPVPLPVPGAADWGGLRIEALSEPAQAGDESIDLDRLDPISSDVGRPSLAIRAPRDGDRFDPLGMHGHTQALNDFLRGRGIPRADRAKVPLVVDRAGIVWVVGHRIAERVRVRGETLRRLGLKVAEMNLDIKKNRE